MNICAIIPVKRLDSSKSRLSSMLDKESRIKLSIYLLEDLLSVVDCVFDSVVVGYDDEVKRISEMFSSKFIKDNGSGVNDAVRFANEYCKAYDATIVLPIDLILLTTIDLVIIKEVARRVKRGIVITPSRRLDGTNILLRKPPLVMDTYYDMDSYLIHIDKALEQGLEVNILLNNRLRYDLDDAKDLKYLLNIEFNIKKKSVEYLKSLFRFC